MKTLKLFFTITLLLTALSLTAQDKQPLKDSLKDFEIMIGKWEGEGWNRSPQGERSEFIQTEDIKYELDKQLVVIHGLGRDKTSNEKIFEAFGVIKYYPEEDAYKMSAYTLEGRQTWAHFEKTDEGFDWWFEIGNGGTVKYQIKLTESTWAEDGSYSPDGKNWYPFFHMDLKKVAP